MDYFEITLRGMRKVLDLCGEDTYRAYIDDCIEGYSAKGDVGLLMKGFSPKGVFADFHFENTVFPTEEKRFWTEQLFGGLVAMSVQLARFKAEHTPFDITFIREHFGHPAEIIEGSVCAGCGLKTITALDIDRYVTMPVIAEAIVEGIDRGDLEARVVQITDLSYPKLKYERDDASVRAINTDISVSSGRTRPTVCLRCGGKNIKTVKFLKSLRKKEFVMLSK